MNQSQRIIEALSGKAKEKLLNTIKAWIGSRDAPKLDIAVTQFQNKLRFQVQGSPTIVRRAHQKLTAKAPKDRGWEAGKMVQSGESAIFPVTVQITPEVEKALATDS